MPQMTIQQAADLVTDERLDELREQLAMPVLDIPWREGCLLPGGITYVRSARLPEVSWRQLQQPAITGWRRRVRMVWFGLRYDLAHWLRALADRLD